MANVCGSGGCVYLPARSFVQTGTQQEGGGGVGLGVGDAIIGPYQLTALKWVDGDSVLFVTPGGSSSWVLSRGNANGTPPTDGWFFTKDQPGVFYSTAWPNAGAYTNYAGGKGPWLAGGPPGLTLQLVDVDGASGLGHLQWTYDNHTYYISIEDTVEKDGTTLWAANVGDYVGRHPTWTMVAAPDNSVCIDNINSDVPTNIHGLTVCGLGQRCGADNQCRCSNGTNSDGSCVCVGGGDCPPGTNCVSGRCLPPDVCLTACASNETCVQNKCISKCNPGCDGQHTCTDDGRCVCTNGSLMTDCSLPPPQPTTCNPACDPSTQHCDNGRCVCNNGMSMPNCTAPPKPCAQGCAANQICRDGQCVCANGSTQPDCSLPPQPTACNPACVHGTCDTSTGKCVCASGYSGDACDAATPTSASWWDRHRKQFYIGVAILLVLIVIVGVVSLFASTPAPPPRAPRPLATTHFIQA